MAQSEDLSVEVREETGTNKVKKLRAAGKIPAVIYGHGGDTVSLSVPADALSRIIHRGERIVGLTGGVTGDAFIRDVQWDTFGSEVLHVDFTRVEAGEMLSTTVNLHLRGVAPGTKMGGVIEQSLKEMELLCPPRSMTDTVDVVVNELQVGEKITVGDLDLPEGAKATLDPSTPVVACTAKGGEEEVADEAAPAADGAEPEVIGKKDDDGEDS